MNSKESVKELYKEREYLTDQSSFTVGQVILLFSFFIRMRDQSNIHMESVLCQMS